MTSVGVVLRTKNEARWIRYCIQALLGQVGIDRIEIALVDCNSEDMTVERALAIEPNIRVVYYEGEYFPGKSINLGIAVLPDVEYIVVLSAHCVPVGVDWLKNFLVPLESNRNYAASYCRQIPTSASTPENRRDLLNTFSIESRTQTKDTFFHNAASTFRRGVWEEVPFDESLRHVEDRYWADALIARNYQIFYNADCSVVHEHGLNQHDREYRSFRGEGVAGLLSGDDKLAKNWTDQAEKSSAVLVIALSSLSDSGRLNEILLNAHENQQCYILPKRNIDASISNKTIPRRKEWEELSLFELLRELLFKFANEGSHYDYLYFFDADKSEYRGSLPSVYLRKSIQSGADLCVAVESFKEDFFVLKNDERSWVPINETLMDSYINKPHFKKALYGEGVLIRSSLLIEKRMPEIVFLDG